MIPKKATFDTKNTFFMDSSFVPKSDYFRKLRSVGANLYQGYYLKFCLQSFFQKTIKTNYLTHEGIHV